MGNRSNSLFQKKKEKKKGGEKKKGEKRLKTLKITAPLPPSCDILTVTVTIVLIRNAFLLECHQQSQSCSASHDLGEHYWFLGTLGFLSRERLLIFLSCNSIPQVFPETWYDLILVEWVFWVWKDQILDFSKIISQLKLRKRYVAQGHLDHWGVCWIFLDLSMLPAVIWVTWTKRLLRHKAGAKWTLWMYFHYFFCMC